MNYRRLIVLMMPLLSACAGTSVMQTAQPGPAVEPEQVRVSFAMREPCDFEVIGQIEIAGWYFRRESIVEAFREKAAGLGAHAVQIHYLQKRDISEFIGQARAIRCLDQAAAGQLSSGFS